MIVRQVLPGTGIRGHCLQSSASGASGHAGIDRATHHYTDQIRLIAYLFSCGAWQAARRKRKGNTRAAIVPVNWRILVQRCSPRCSGQPISRQSSCSIPRYRAICWRPSASLRAVLCVACRHERSAIRLAVAGGVRLSSKLETFTIKRQFGIRGSLFRYTLGAETRSVAKRSLAHECT